MCPIEEQKKKKSELFNLNLIYCTNRVHDTQTKKKLFSESIYYYF